MSLSISAVERNNPPPRRKSCSACIKAKRRCTQETPACQRCTQRSLACQYPEGRVSKRPLPASTPSNNPSHSLTGPPSALPTPGSSWDFAVWENPSAYPESQEPVNAHSILLDGADALDLFNFNTVDPTLGDLGVAANDSAQIPREMAAGVPDDMGTNRIIYDLVIPGPPAALPQTAAVAWAFKNRLNFALDKIRDAPRRMVCENQTPWSHPCLYEHSMPQSMQDAYSSCALHLSKNPINTDIITRNIESRITTLLSTPLPLSSPRELLSRVQSLLLYQILRVLDNSYKSFSAINDTIAPLEEAAFALMSHITFEEGTFDSPSDHPLQPPTSQQPPAKSDEILPLYPLDTTRKFWEVWVFQESARRTFLIVFFFVQIYRLMKGEVPTKCDGRLGMNSSFTLGEGVWKARDPLSFGIAWGEGRRWAVKNAKAEDVDVFSKMVLSSFLGIDEARGWLMSTGGDL
ncbi:uncharacterized protein PODANS_6_520 [Podospora anserina S mat+]|uniref:Podospora anserina S mat+ genomic DNA chromosome 6, supercontig 2 n=1 Tax=Podospora anserina (strain S / ATCC MYA-4624 / DSM 980 / FGSC 10383) TaxID=515849 RepID=B2B3B5_PODAN|nr:uncharacterized protein PODANS_6_520 [Podospora anserina S mat+]CAP71601.1 unnamed protein product [Podospora anserina S mat+]CDP30996.1 Putative protein of unknown function [Podospora anserina S mat+]